MAYQPTRNLANSGFANVKFTGPDSDTQGFNHLAQNFIAERQRQYNETNDFYDLQREEMQDLSKVLEGTYGADNQYLNNLVVKARDEYKEVLKGLKLKDYNSPAVQDKIFELKNRLMKAKNLSATSLEQIKQGVALSKGDHMKEDDISLELRKQLSLPPDQRDPDILLKLQTDPLYFNLYDYLTKVLDSRKTITEPLQKRDDNFFYSFKATYRPELGYFDKGGDWVFDPRPEVIEEALQNTQFYNGIIGMMKPELVKSLRGSGDKNKLKEAVHNKAKEYMQAVFIREEGGKRVGVYDPQLEQTGRTLNPAKYSRPTTYDKREDDMENEVAAVKQRLIDGNPKALDEYIADDGYTHFGFKYDSQGRIIKIIASRLDTKNPLHTLSPEKAMKYEPIDVDPDDPGSVRQLINRLKYPRRSDKDKVQAYPLRPQPEKSSNKSKPYDGL